MKYFLAPIILLIKIVFIQLSVSEESLPLYLTPLIKQGKISKAQKLAKVNLPLSNNEHFGINDASEIPKSYSGFITVNEELGTNLFFWFFPSEIKNAPLVLWNDGGPGACLFHSFFNLNGPFKFNKDRKVVRRPDNGSIHSEFNTIYLDVPAGVGFSFTKDEKGYSHSASEAATIIYEFLQQFLKLFPELRDNDFYNGGASYGGTYATSIAHLIHSKNQELEDLSEKINLKGLFLDSPWLDPALQSDYGTWLYSAGLISKKSKEHFDKKRDEILKLLSENKLGEAWEVWFSVAIIDIASYTGLPSFYDFVDKDLDAIALHNHNYTNLVTSQDFRKALHAGETSSFFMFSPDTQSRMKDKFMTSVKKELEQLLDAKEEYKILMISGDLDLITGHLGIEEVALSLDWSGGEEFRGQELKQAWMDGGRFAGNIQTNGRLVFALVRSAGHGAAMNQPERVLELMKGFVKGELGLWKEDDEEDFSRFNSGMKEEL